MRRALPLPLAVFLITSIVAPRAARAKDEETAAPAADDDAELFTCAKPATKLTVNLKPDVELKDLVTWAMGFSCKKFLYGSALSARTAKVTMITPGAMSAPQAWGVFEVALHSMGLTLVTKGNVLEIVESPTANNEALAIRRSFPDGGGDVVRLLLRPEHVDVGDLATALELVKSKYGVVAPLPRLRAVLVTDDADHIARMKPLVAELDQPTTSDAVYAIPLVHVDAASVVTTLTKLLDPQAAGGANGGAAPVEPHLRLVADARSNALFLAGTAADYVRVKALAGAIDVDTGVDSGAHLIRLSHARAKDVAASLNALLTGGGATAGAAPRATADAGASPGAFTPNGTVRVTADEASNSLMVMASQHDAASLRGLVEELDAPVQQVYIEALVLEVEASNDQQIGVSWHGGKAGSTDGSILFGGLISDGLSSIAPKDSAGSIGLLGGTLGDILPGSETLLGTTIPSYGLLLHAATHTSRLDVLASPHLLTVDNRKAKISVGSNIPYRSTAASVSATGQVMPPQISRKPVALTLEITPHIAPLAPEAASSARQVTLDINLESDQIGNEDFGGGLGPTWKERSLDTSVVLHDEESLVLGGLVDERSEDTTDKIPILGDIPVLGGLFRSTHKIRQKSNLLIIITPHVLDDSAEGREILERRMRERDEFVRSSDELERRVWTPPLHPEKLRGLVAEIDATMRTVERERAELAAAARPTGVAPGPIDPPATAAPAITAPLTAAP